MMEQLDADEGYLPVQQRGFLVGGASGKKKNRGKDRLSPNTMGHVVLPDYKSARDWNHRDETSDSLWDEAAQHAAGGYENDGYEDDEMDSINKYGRPTANLRYL